LITIIGCGLSGLIAANMIRDQDYQIYEASNSLPNNHSAVLRFRSSILGDALDIPFKCVQMMKTVERWSNPVADNLAYSRKCTGTATLRSIVTASAAVQERWIAPPDLVQRLANRVEGKVKYGEVVDLDTIKDLMDKGPIISTIPMLQLIGMLDYKFAGEWQGHQVHGINVNCILPGVDAYVSIYVPNPLYEFNRISLTGDRLTVEYSFPYEGLEDVRSIASRKGLFHLGEVLCMLGLPDNHPYENYHVSVQRYSKILPIEEDLRRRFIVWATDNWRIYSLGRYATWRPTLILDDLVNDVRVIRRFIGGESSYSHRKK